ncbi:MAG: hypothetical protein CO156_02030 [Candidatus Pacebacteria bacterium CG_4_9_14_3_um_filter_40_12]|nr:hypothetical protein [Candidatus Paceibacterota bacterium]PIZ79642.1 MAG: hypothetical protein COY01_00780 [Candidatus Pacebacteria bacterium CG_4_10_14_0_2_um_filter_40_20]PJA69095.1 MAG: hypothetical protein CO156_02030 [Candidatus Pacebacteria bacterium CG_4_9_14_3_um_filter_40_12]PJC41771.1 MAG: hypothetical protein CO041_03575 [Candidatus Pacebacteria bacterium CG_4_9_14_0_2_um_filter_40_15]
MPLLSLVPHSNETSSDSPELLVLGIWISNTAIKTLLLRLKAGAVTLVSNSQMRAFFGLDQAVSVADALLQDLGPESEGTNDVMFVVDQSWVVDGDISSDKKPYLKAITTELGLSPIGFVDQTEAVTNFAIQNNPRFSGIFAFVESKSISITVVEHASITGTEVVGRSTQAAKDIVEGLARFSQASDEKAGYLPPQLFLVSVEETELGLKDIQQRLLSEPITDAAKFLQSPMISVVSQQEYISRIVQEAGVAIADAKGLASAKKKTTIPLRDQVVRVADETANVTPVSAAELGFKDFESGQSEFQEAETEAEDPNETAIDVPTSFGIPIKAESAKEFPSQKEQDESERHHSKTAEPEGPKKEKQKAKMGFFKSHHKNPKIFIGLGVGLGLLVLAIIGGFVLLFQSTADVAVALSKKVITTEATIEVRAGLAATDVENAVLAAETVKHTVSGENTILTTGVKVVGENAKGTITLYNKTTADKDLGAGTVVKAGDRSYTLDEDVTLPAASVTETTSGEKKEYGTLETQVTATDIGAEGNIAKETEMTVGSFADSTYSAISEKEFTGGSSREVRVVSASDQAEAVKELQKELEAQASQELEEKLADGVYLLPNLEVLEKKVTFSSDIDDEVNEVTASLTLTVEALEYTSNSLQPLAAALLASQVKEGYVLSSEPPSILSQPLVDEQASSSATFILANISSEAIPVLDLENLYQYVLGKKTDDAVRNLKDYQGISDVTVQINPSILSTIPKDKDRVQIHIVDTQ